jgi:WD40 repeat protein
LKVVWSPIDGILAISGTEEVQIRNTSNGALLKILHTSDYSPFDSAGIDWSPDGTKLVTANSGWLRIWNIDSGNILTSFSDGRNFESVAWSPDGNFIASTGGTDNDIAIGDVVSSELERTLRGHTGYISDLAWSTGGLASSSYDKTIRIWDVASGQTTEIIPTLNQVLSITWSPDGKMLAYGDGGLLKIARLQATDDG